MISVHFLHFLAHFYRISCTHFGLSIFFSALFLPRAPSFAVVTLVCCCSFAMIGACIQLQVNCNIQNLFLPWCSLQFQLVIYNAPAASFRSIACTGLHFQSAQKVAVVEKPSRLSHHSTVFVLLYSNNRLGDVRVLIKKYSSFDSCRLSRHGARPTGTANAAWIIALRAPFDITHRTEVQQSRLPTSSICKPALHSASSAIVATLEDVRRVHLPGVHALPVWTACQQNRSLNQLQPMKPF